ncbi:MAG: hypothetical protein JXE07_02285 [Candidatus Aminicenantes bacterium]|nr:hypothetical protein [Candidatus Aminicenantes bacterium]
MKEKWDRLSVCIIFLLVLYTFAAAAGMETAEMQTVKVELPQTAGSWTKNAPPRTITAENIFEYMDGAGELYIGYRFDRLEVIEYEAPGETNILVEVYFMKTPDDAFGLLSLDWGGEPVDFGAGARQGAEKDINWPYALYGEGLLRLRSDKIYARIMAEQETPRSKEAVLALGRAVVKDLAVPSSPTLLGRLPETLGPGWMLRRERTSYFRSHLVLNSLYFLSHENMFELGHETEAAFALYEKDTPAGPLRIFVLFVQYPDARAAGNALGHFQRVYLPDRAPSPPERPIFFSVEDGWLGYKLTGRRTAFIFECPDKQTAEAFMDRL